jgi:peptidoglycan/LPS O-acetylase OafA/YrhL
VGVPDTAEARESDAADPRESVDADSRSETGAPSPALAPPPGNPRFPLFDGLRALAVLGVLAFHSSELTGRIGFGVTGRFAEVAGGQAVNAFFVISGFLLYRPFVSARMGGRSRPSSTRYARRRALRILPAYWVALTLLAIYPGIVGPFSHDWWRYYGYLQVYSLPTQQQGIAVAWTLCVEMSFYVVLPLWALAVSRVRIGRGMRGTLAGELLPLAVVALGGAVVQVAAARRLVAYPVATSLPGECLWLAIGMALAVASAALQHDGRLPDGIRAVSERAGLCWAISAAAFVGLMLLVPSGGLFGLIAGVQRRQAIAPTLARLVLGALVVTFLVMPAVFGDRRGGFPRRFLAWRPLVGLGVISYSFYLWHLTIVELLAQGGHPGQFSAAGWNVLGRIHFARPLVLFVLSLALTTVVATISYRCIELPFLRRKEPQREPASSAR